MGVDGEEEIVMRRSGFIFFCPIDNFLQFFKVQSKFDPLITPYTLLKPISYYTLELITLDQSGIDKYSLISMHKMQFHV
jgi:hypothetical protein